MELVQYKEEYKQRVFDFTDRCFEELGKKFEPEGRHYFYNDIEKFFVSFYCLLDDEKLIGTVALKKIDDYTVELKALYLDKSYRGQHLGSRLIKAAIAEAKTRGFKSMVLDSMSKYKEALRLYEKCGFRNTERFNDNVYADVFMKLELKGVNMFESDYAKTDYIEKDNVVFHVWKKEAHFDDYRDPVKASLELLREHKDSIFIVDARNGFEDVKEDVEWGFNYFLPELKKTGCTIWGFILPEVSEIEGEIDLWTREIEKNFRVIRAVTYEDILRQI